MHSARSRGSDGDFTVGRAGLGFGPDLDTANRGTDRRVKGRLLHRDRHPQYAAGGAAFRLHRLHVSRRTDRVRRNRTHLYASETKAYGRLYYRAIWVSPPKERVAMASEKVHSARWRRERLACRRAHLASQNRGSSRAVLHPLRARAKGVRCRLSTSIESNFAEHRDAAVRL